MHNIILGLIYSGPEVLFKTCVAMKFVDDDDDDDDDESYSSGVLVFSYFITIFQYCLFFSRVLCVRVFIWALA